MSELTESRKGKDRFMASDHHSPLTADQRRTFTGLSYFGENPDLRFVIEPEPYESQEVVEMQTSTGDVASYVRWGKVTFEVEGGSGFANPIQGCGRAGALPSLRGCDQRQGDLRRRAIPRPARAERGDGRRGLQPRIQPLLRLQRAVELSTDSF